MIIFICMSLYKVCHIGLVSSSWYYYKLVRAGIVSPLKWKLRITLPAKGRWNQSAFVALWPKGAVWTKRRWGDWSWFWKLIECLHNLTKMRVVSRNKRSQFLPSKQLKKKKCPSKSVVRETEWNLGMYSRFQDIQLDPVVRMHMTQAII